MPAPDQRPFTLREYRVSTPLCTTALDATRVPGPPLYRPQVPRLTALPLKSSEKAGAKPPLEAVGAAEAADGARRPAPKAAAAAPASRARRRSEKRRDLCCKGVAPWGICVRGLRDASGKRRPAVMAPVRRPARRLCTNCLFCEV